MTDQTILIKKLHTFKQKGYKTIRAGMDFFEVDIEMFSQQLNNCVDELLEAIGHSYTQEQALK